MCCSKKIKILIVIVTVLIVLLITYKLVFKRKIIQPIPISNEVLEEGTLTVIELQNLANQIRNQIKGITIFEEEYLLSLNNLSDIDLVRIYNTYLELFSVSLYQDIISEWYWESNQSLFNAVKQRFINLHINV